MTLEKKIAKTIKRVFIIAAIVALSIGCIKVLLYLFYGENADNYGETIELVFLVIGLIACGLAFIYYPMLWIFEKAQD